MFLKIIQWIQFKPLPLLCCVGMDLLTTVVRSLSKHLAAAPQGAPISFVYPNNGQGKHTPNMYLLVSCELLKKSKYMQNFTFINYVWHSRTQLLLLIKSYFKMSFYVIYRVASMPNTGVEEEYYRLRHFSITGKGVINRGDSLKTKRSRSNNSVASSNSRYASINNPQYTYRIKIII